jgi:GNAT superfamily N-acetyltransferase
VPQVTAAELKDIEAIAALLVELDAFYGATDVEPLDQRLQQIREALFSEANAGHALLAWDGSELVGLAAYSFLWPAVGLTRSLFLKELYVAKSHQRQGVGKLLMEGLTAVAAEHGCSRVEWMTEKTNTAAQQFYAALDAPVDESKVFYRVTLGAE